MTEDMGRRLWEYPLIRERVAKALIRCWVQNVANPVSLSLDSMDVVIDRHYQDRKKCWDDMAIAALKEVSR